MCAFIREVSSESNSVIKLITFMIDSDNEEVRLHTYNINNYLNTALHHKDYQCRAPVSNVHEYHNGRSRKVYSNHLIVSITFIPFSKECQSILRHAINECFSHLKSDMDNAFLSATQR